MMMFSQLKNRGNQSEIAVSPLVQHLHDRDPRQRRWTVARYQHQDFDRRLPFRKVGFLLRKLVM